MDEEIEGCQWNRIGTVGKRGVREPRNGIEARVNQVNRVFSLLDIVCRVLDTLRKRSQ